MPWFSCPTLHLHFGCRFGKTGSMADTSLTFEEATVMHCASDSLSPHHPNLTSPSHPKNYYSSLTSLGLELWDRFRRTGLMADLEAISMHRFGKTNSMTRGYFKSPFLKNFLSSTTFAYWHPTALAALAFTLRSVKYNHATWESNSPRRTLSSFHHCSKLLLCAANQAWKKKFGYGESNPELPRSVWEAAMLAVTPYPTTILRQYLHIMTSSENR